MLDSTQIEKLRMLLAMGGWNDVMKPVIQNRAHNAVRALVLDPSEREGEFKGMEDSAIRARVREAEWMLSAWANEVAVHDHNRRLDELDRQRTGDGIPGGVAANP